ncbi:MAG: TIGR02996 domain-containing protein [Bacteroidales bacterium]|nr:TIGR02996 domain-containing protein [Bacteroidales bacterium]
MTAQMAERLIYAGERHALFSNPLESLFTDQFPRPEFIWESSANWRGYVGTWEIREDRLYLSALDGRARLPDRGEGAFSLRDLFPHHPVGGVLAEWCEETLRIPMGKQIHYIHMGYGSQYERDCYLAIRKGRVVLKEIVNNTMPDRTDSSVTYDIFSSRFVVPNQVECQLTPHLEEVYPTEEAAFLRAVFAVPNDPMPQLVYADWLEEHGDPRAEWIRLEQLRRGQSTPELEKRRQQLLRDRPRDWVWLQIMRYITLYNS